MKILVTEYSIQEVEWLVFYFSVDGKELQGGSCKFNDCYPFLDKKQSMKVEVVNYLNEYYPGADVDWAEGV